MERKKITIPELQAMKQRGEKIVRSTCYDYPTAVLMERAGMHMLNIGDSVGMTMLGYETTIPVTMDEMIHHCRAVARGAKSPFLSGDLPFMSYQESVSQAVRNAGRLMKEGNVDGIKLEGGREMASTIHAIVQAGIPVQAHIGLTPQYVAMLGGFKVQGKDAAAAKKLIDDALALEDAGAYAITLECVPDRLARLITERLTIPTLGIGAGPWCDGQTQVLHDMIGLNPRFTPKFVKKRVDLSALILQALEEYKQEVQAGTFPGPEHCFTIKDEEMEKLLKGL